jgi:hypothetical protein
VQYRETDFNFVSRLMEQEGIYYFFEHENDKHTLVLADSKSAHQPFPEYGTVTYRLEDQVGVDQPERPGDDRPAEDAVDDPPAELDLGEAVAVHDNDTDGTFPWAVLYDPATGQRRFRRFAGFEAAQEALAEAEGAQRWIDKDSRPWGDHAWRDYFWLLPMLRRLIDYKLDPTEKNKEAARKGLNPTILKSQDHGRTLFLLFYLFNLRAKYPELID